MMNGTTTTLTELREAMTAYKAFLETGVRGTHTFYTDPRDGSGYIPAGEVECFSISGVHATQELRSHKIRLEKAVAAARAEQSLRPALDALPGGCYGFSTWDSTVNPPAIAESHRAQVKPLESWPWCEYVRADLLDALDRALFRLPTPTVDHDESAKKKPGAWLAEALLLLKNTEGRVSNADIATAVERDPGTISRNKVLRQARATYTGDAPPRGHKNAETGDLDVYTNRPARKK